MKGFTKNGKFHPIRNKRSPSVTRQEQKRSFAKQNDIKILKHNRFHDHKAGESMWGHIIAVSNDNKKAILVAKNQSIFPNGVQWGKLYQVSAKNEKVGRKKYPTLDLDRQVSKVPKRNWSKIR